MNTILRISLSVTLCILLGGTVLPAFPRPAAQDQFRQVDAYVNETMRRLPIRGLAVAIVQGDQVLYMKGYGTANRQGDPVTPQTPFMLGSVTKTFTALAVQQLIRTGKINEFSPVQVYLPDFRLADDRHGAGVTVRHLLDHTSGISTAEGVQSYLSDPKTSFPQALDQLAHFRPQYRPGEHYEYSNWNYSLLREVIVQVSGQSYTSYVQEHILNPLAMTHSSFSDYRSLPKAASYDLNVFGFPVPYDEPYSPMILGAGYLSASVEDMTHYLIAFLNLGQYRDQRLLPDLPSGWYDAYWNWQMSDPEGARIQFTGGHNSTSANIQLIPQARLGVVVAMNTRLDEVLTSAPASNDIAANIANLVMGEPYTLPDFNGFYVGTILIDGVLLLLIASIAWQALGLAKWRQGYRAAQPARRAAAWLGIVLDLLLCAGILALPRVFQVSWSSILYLRPDFAIPVLTIGICLGALGWVKAAAGLLEHR